MRLVRKCSTHYEDNEGLVGKPQEKKLLEVLRAEGRKILKWISKNYFQGLAEDVVQ
jgi:hypothetical protein